MTTWGDLAAATSGVVAPRRAALFTAAGTWSADDQGFQADVSAGVDPDLYEVKPVDYPASFGPIPGGAVSGITSPSYQESVTTGVANVIAAINAWVGKFALSGYSQGAEVTSRVLIEILTGSLKHRRGDLLGGVNFGDPCREEGHTYAGDSLDGHGISPVNVVGTPVDWNSYAHAGDMYACVPNDDSGKDITAVYEEVTLLQFHDIPQMAEQMANALGGAGGLATQVKQLIANPIGEVPMALKAASIAIGFAASGAMDHGTYGSDDCGDGSGRTSVQHAIDHLNRIAA